MRFLMLVCRDESIELTPADRASMGSHVAEWVSEMETRRVRVLGEVLAPLDDTTTVRVRSGGRIVDDGPRASGPASGFNLIECRDLDEAIEVAAAHPIARFGDIELRPIA